MQGWWVTHSTVIADLIRNPEGRGLGIQQDNTTYRIPLSLDGRGIKGEGENDALHGVSPLCGYCLKASMTATPAPPPCGLRIKPAMT